MTNRTINHNAYGRMQMVDKPARMQAMRVMVNGFEDCVPPFLTFEVQVYFASDLFVFHASGEKRGRNDESVGWQDEYDAVNIVSIVCYPRICAQKPHEVRKMVNFYWLKEDHFLEEERLDAVDDYGDDLIDGAFCKWINVKQLSEFCHMTEAELYDQLQSDSGMSEDRTWWNGEFMWWGEDKFFIDGVPLPITMVNGTPE